MSVEEDNDLTFENSRPCPKCNSRVPNPDMAELPVEDDCPWCGAYLQWEYDLDDEGQMYFWLELNQNRDGDNISRGIRPEGEIA